MRIFRRISRRGRQVLAIRQEQHHMQPQHVRDLIGRRPQQVSSVANAGQLTAETVQILGGGGALPRQRWLACVPARSGCWRDARHQHEYQQGDDILRIGNVNVCVERWQEKKLYARAQIRQANSDGTSRTRRHWPAPPPAAPARTLETARAWRSNRRSSHAKTGGAEDEAAQEGAAVPTATRTGVGDVTMSSCRRRCSRHDMDTYSLRMRH